MSTLTQTDNIIPSPGFIETGKFYREHFPQVKLWVVGLPYDYQDKGPRPQSKRVACSKSLVDQTFPPEQGYRIYSGYFLVNQKFKFIE